MGPFWRGESGRLSNRAGHTRNDAQAVSKGNTQKQENKSGWRSNTLWRVEHLVLYILRQQTGVQEEARTRGRPVPHALSPRGTLNISLDRTIRQAPPQTTEQSAPIISHPSAGFRESTRHGCKACRASLRVDSPPILLCCTGWPKSNKLPLHELHSRSATCVPSHLS